MKRRPLRQAVDAKCRDCGGQEGGARHWRQHVSACPVTSCPLWPVRPIASENPPAWLASREPGQLPQGFLGLRTEEAIAVIRGAAPVFRPVTGRNSETEVPSAPEEGRDVP